MEMTGDRKCRNDRTLAEHSFNLYYHDGCNHVVSGVVVFVVFVVFVIVVSVPPPQPSGASTKHYLRGAARSVTNSSPPARGPTGIRVAATKESSAHTTARGGPVRRILAGVAATPRIPPHLTASWISSSPVCTEGCLLSVAAIPPSRSRLVVIPAPRTGGNVGVASQGVAWGVATPVALVGARIIWLLLLPILLLLLSVLALAALSWHARWLGRWCTIRLLRWSGAPRQVDGSSAARRLRDMLTTHATWPTTVLAGV